MEKLSDQFDQDQLINEFKAVVADAEALIKATANSGDDKLSDLRARAEESLGIAKARIMDIQTEVLAKTKAAAKATDAYVHENPWRSIGFAASIGVVVGLLISRR
ncbi:DUF883 family protein [Methylotenera versatilis]|jgi:ElaB/YqjD/DUF883 family membrane-anchored ribosome-binding protein|uniref:DUF883 domain-containing protein n=1 Tax=Methylotenera versatilis (strain 301) TaxID=666681 RepID=D7DPZ1_METV0|nr:DUF883 family protein [Methylotenera versatilis]ADI29362.1 protein of unknown function DUF883 ElaB [Methylotenera versatilis 301]